VDVGRLRSQQRRAPPAAGAAGAATGAEQRVEGAHGGLSMVAEGLVCARAMGFALRGARARCNGALPEGRGLRSRVKGTHSRGPSAKSLLSGAGQQGRVLHDPVQGLGLRLPAPAKPPVALPAKGAALL